jgi:hypothetical protein
MKIIFPRPANGQIQVLQIRRRDLFGQAMLAGRNPKDILPLQLNPLRDYATRALGIMNLVPA